jgi:hypothetical protein
MEVATATGGACKSCAAVTGTPHGCAASCPACVNAVDSYLVRSEIARCSKLCGGFVRRCHITRIVSRASPDAPRAGTQASCSGDFEALNYGTLEAYAGSLAITNDCFDWINLAARPYASAFCSGAFDHIIQARACASSQPWCCAHRQADAATAPAHSSCKAPRRTPWCWTAAAR